MLPRIGGSRLSLTSPIEVGLAETAQTSPNGSAMPTLAGDLRQLAHGYVNAGKKGNQGRIRRVGRLCLALKSQPRSLLSMASFSSVSHYILGTGRLENPLAPTQQGFGICLC